MKHRQAVLDELQLSPQDAISLADIPTGADGVKPVSIRMQRRLLQFLAGFSSDQCWMSTAKIAQRLDHTERTVRAALRVLVATDLVIESGPRNRRFRSVHWTEIGRRVPRMRAVVDPVNRAIPSGQLVPNGPDDPVTRDRIQYEELEETTTTTTTAPDVVVVELETVLARASEAVRLARERGLTDEAIRGRYRRWLELPERDRLKGTLYNWLAIDGSYSEPRKPAPISGRGDGLSKRQVELEALRARTFRAGRKAGASQEEIEAKCREIELWLRATADV